MVNACKKFPNIAFQDIASPRIIFTCLVSKFAETVHGFVRPFADPAGIRIRDKCPIKELI